MTFDELLQDAARDASNALLNSLPPEEQCLHSFSNKYQKKYHRMLRRTKHPYLYQTLHHVAGFLLIFVLSSFIWLSADANARSDFSGWLQTIYRNSFIYHHIGVDQISAESTYALAEFPEDWFQIDYWSDEMSTTFVYQDASGNKNYFSYSHTTTDLLIVYDSDIPTITNISGVEAHYYPAHNPEENSTLIWSMDGTLFQLSASLNQEQLQAIAEHVEKSSS